MNLDHDFVQVWKISEGQKKKQMEHFSPNLSEEQKKKKSSSKIRTLFSPNSGEDQKKVFNKNKTLFSLNLRSDVHPSKLLGSYS